MTTTHRVFAAFGLALLPLPALHAQAAGATATLSDETRHQAFDYLLGDWEFTGERNGRNGRIVSIERSGNLAEGRAWKDGNGMRIEQSYGGPVLRFRYYDIQPNRFSWVGSGRMRRGSITSFSGSRPGGWSRIGRERWRCGSIDDCRLTIVDCYSSIVDRQSSMVELVQHPPI